MRSRQTSPSKGQARTKDLVPNESILHTLDGPVADAAVVEKIGGHIITSHKEPFGGHPGSFAVLPIGEPILHERSLWGIGVLSFKRVRDAKNVATGCVA